MIRLLIVDDSAFIRSVLTRVLDQDPDIDVIGTAADGFEAIEKATALHPDVITMDVQMPRMDGITAVERIMKECPCPILMFSSLTLKGAETTLKSLHAGAVDVLAKDHSLHMGLGADTMGEVTSKIKQIYASRHSILSGTQALLARSKAPGARPVRTRPLKVGKDKIRAIAIGISTGGPLSLHDVLPELSESFTLPLFIVQHMPPRFTKTLADRLDSRCSHTVVEAEQGMIVQSGSIYLAPGGKHMTLIRGAGMVKIQVSDEPKDRLHRPSVDVLFESAAAVYGNQLLGLIMTGMGNDGTKGARAIKESGGLIYAQDEASCVVYGMPKAVTLAGLVDDVLSLSDIAPALNKLAQSSVRVVSA